MDIEAAVELKVVAAVEEVEIATEVVVAPATVAVQVAAEVEAAGAVVVEIYGGKQWKYRNSSRGKSRSNNRSTAVTAVEVETTAAAEGVEATAVKVDVPGLVKVEATFEVAEK